MTLVQAALYAFMFCRERKIFQNALSTRRFPESYLISELSRLRRELHVRICLIARRLFVKRKIEKAKKWNCPSPSKNFLRSLF